MARHAQGRKSAAVAGPGSSRPLLGAILVLVVAAGFALLPQIYNPTANAASSALAFAGWPFVGGNPQGTSATSDLGPFPTGDLGEPTELGVLVSSPPVVSTDGTKVAVATANGVRIFDTRTGAPQSPGATGTAQAAQAAQPSAPAWVDANTLYFATADGKLHFWNTQTRVDKTTDIKLKDESAPRIAGGPTLGDGVVYVPADKLLVFGRDGSFYMRSGKLSAPISTPVSVGKDSAGNDVVVFGSGNALNIYIVKKESIPVTKPSAVLEQGAIRYEQEWYGTEPIGGNRFGYPSMFKVVKKLADSSVGKAAGLTDGLDIRGTCKPGVISDNGGSAVCNSPNRLARLSCSWEALKRESGTGATRSSRDGGCAALWLSKQPEPRLSAHIVGSPVIIGGIHVLSGRIIYHLGFDGSIQGNEDLGSNVQATGMAAVPYTGGGPSGISWVAGGKDGKIYINWEKKGVKSIDPAQAKGAVKQVVLVQSGGKRGLALTEDGYLVAFDPVAAKELWSVKVADKPTGMAVAGGKVYIAAGTELYTVTGVLASSFKATLSPAAGYQAGLDENTNTWGKVVFGADLVYQTALSKAELTVDPAAFKCDSLSEGLKGKPKASAFFNCQPLKGGDSKWKITVTDGLGIKHETPSRTISVAASKPADTAGPDCTIDQQGGQLINPYGSISLIATCTDEQAFESGVDSAEIQISENGGAFKKVKTLELGGENEAAFGYLCSRQVGTIGCHAGKEGASYKLRVVATDKSENENTFDLPIFIVDDVTPPEISGLASAASTAPDQDITLSAKVTDVGTGVLTVTFIVGEKELNGQLGTGDTWSAKFNAFRDSVGTDLQGQAVSWSVKATDKSSREAASDRASFTVADTTRPNVALLLLGRATVFKGQEQRFQFRAEDNFRLASVELLINGKSKKSVTLRSPAITSHFILTPADYADITTLPSTVKFSLRATDQAGNTFSTTEKTFTLTQPCPLFDNVAPTITNAKVAGSPIPGQEMTFTAGLSDSGPAEAAACTFLESAAVEVDWSGTFSVASSQVFPESAKTATASMKVKIPDPRKGFKALIVLPFGGRFGGALGLPQPGGFGTTGRAVTVGGGGTGGGGEDEEAPSDKVGGLPGQTVRWRFVAYDLAGNKQTGSAQSFVIQDKAAPVIQSVDAPIKVLSGEDATVKICAYDWNVKPATINLTVTEGANLPRVLTKQLTASGGDTECVDFAVASTNLKPGDTVAWSATAVDAAGLEAEAKSGAWTFRSLPPVFGRAIGPLKVKPGQTVQLGKEVSDDNGLKEASLLVDTGSGFGTVATQSLSGTKASAVFNYKIALAPGSTFNWMLTVTDVDGNVAENDPAATVEEDSGPPTFTAQSQSADSVEAGQSIILSVTVADDAGLESAALETDESGSFQAIDTRQLDGTAQNALTFTWTNTQAATKVVNWRVTATDVNGNVGTSETKNFTALEPPKVCPVCPSPTEYSECSAEGTQTRTAYECSADTSFTCAAKIESKSCTPGGSAQAFGAITAARQAISSAGAEGTDVSAAQALLTDAELAFAQGDYATAQAKAAEAEAAIGKAAGGPVPVDIVIVVMVLVAIVAGSVLYFSKKRGLVLFGGKPAVPAAPPATKYRR